MKKQQVVIGGSYLAKVSGKVVPVRITGESKFGGWDAVNTETNKAVRVKSAQRLRRPADAKTKAAATSGNPLLHAKAEDFLGVLTKATVAQMEQALSIGVLTPKDRGRIQAALANRAKKAEPDVGSQETAALQTAAKVASKVLGVPVDVLPPKVKATKPEGKMSGLDAAAKVLAEAGQPLNAKQIVEAMAAKGYWTSDAATPHATIYAAMLIEARKKGSAARFVKVDRGLWTLATAGKQAK